VVGAVVDAFNRGDLEATLEHVDPEVTVHDPARTGASYRGHTELLRFWREWLETWDDYRIEPAELVESGEEVFLACRQTGRGRASGLEVDQDLYLVLGIRGGRITEFRIYADRGQALASAGLDG
jgi:ketosteroid isomerase-like protein